MATYHHRCGSRGSTLASVALSASLLVAFTLAGTGSAPVLFPAAPPSGGIVVDEARLIAPLDQVDLEGLAIALKRDRGYPITVVTIQSLSAHGAAGYTIERYAAAMLKAWSASGSDRCARCRRGFRPARCRGSHAARSTD